MALGIDTFCGYGKFGENTMIEAERMAAAGLAPEKVLKAATKDAAEHLGTDAFGRVATGKRADLLLIDGDPTADITALRKVVMVVKDGAILIDKMSPLLRSAFCQQKKCAAAPRIAAFGPPVKAVNLIRSKDLRLDRHLKVAGQTCYKSA